jgi:hypothetical protein
MKATTTNLVVTGLGAAVTGAGRIVGGSMGATITGFGMAHIVLGLLDMTRPTINHNHSGRVW